MLEKSKGRLRHQLHAQVRTRRIVLATPAHSAAKAFAVERSRRAALRRRRITRTVSGAATLPTRIGSPSDSGSVALLHTSAPPGCLLAHGGAGRQQQEGRGHAAGPHPCGHALFRGGPRCRRPQKSLAGDASKTDPDDPPERPPEEAQREAQQHGSEQQRAQSQQFPCGRGLLTIGSTDPPRDGHRLNHRNPSRCSPELPSPTTGTGPASSVTPGPGRGRGRRWLEWSGARSRRRAG